MIETWKKELDKNNIIGAIIMDLSKAFDTINHKLLLSKLEAYGFSPSAVKLIRSYLSIVFNGQKLMVSLAPGWK